MCNVVISRAFKSYADVRNEGADAHDDAGKHKTNRVKGYVDC